MQATRLTKLQVNGAPATESPFVVKNTAGTTTLFEVQGNGVGAPIRYAQVAISNAELAALRATPKELVAAPGTGLVLEFVSIALFLDYTAPGFTETADNMAVRYTDGSGTIVSEAIECTGFIDQTADTMTTGRAKVDVIAAKAACENKALVLHNTGDGEWANSGGSTMRAKVAYRVHQTGW